MLIRTSNQISRSHSKIKLATFLIIIWKGKKLEKIRWTAKITRDRRACISVAIINNNSKTISLNNLTDNYKVNPNLPWVEIQWTCNITIHLTRSVVRQVWMLTAETKQIKCSTKLTRHKMELPSAHRPKPEASASKREVVVLSPLTRPRFFKETKSK